MSMNKTLIDGGEKALVAIVNLYKEIANKMGPNEALHEFFLNEYNGAKDSLENYRVLFVYKED